MVLSPHMSPQEPVLVVLHFLRKFLSILGTLGKYRPPRKGRSPGEEQKSGSTDYHRREVIGAECYGLPCMYLPKFIC